MLINSGRFSPIWRGFALLVVAIVGIASTIASSSGGSGGAPPTVTITSPPPDSETDDPILTVTGTASDETGVASVTVNGIDADPGNNGFATWSAVVTLDEGLNRLTVAAVDSLGFADQTAAEQDVTLTSAPPLVTVSFPPAHSFSDADSLTVTGTATDARSDVASVEVNGVEATSTDGFATWDVVVPLTDGPNTLTVSAADSSGSEDPNAAMVEVTVAADVSGNAVTFGDGYAIALNGNLAYVVDFDADQLVEVNIENGNSRIVSDSVTGNGPDIFGPNGIALINGGTAALVSNFVPDEMLLVDLAGGDRTIVSHANPSNDPKISPNVGAGPTLFGPSGIGFVDDSRVFVSNYAADEIMEVILQSGDRAILSADGTRGSGLPFSQPDGIAVGTSGLAYVTDALEGAVFSVDFTTGNGTGGDRVIHSADGTRGSGPPFVRPVGIILDDANNRAIVTDYDVNLLLSVGMNNGNRRVFSDANSNVGTGPAFIFPAGIALDAANNRAVVSGGNLIVVEMGSGDRVIVGRRP